MGVSYCIIKCKTDTELIERLDRLYETDVVVGFYTSNDWLGKITEYMALVFIKDEIINLKPKKGCHK